MIYIQYTEQRLYGDSKYFCGFEALRAFCYMLATIVMYGVLASLVILGVYAKLQRLTDAISSDLIIDWSWEERLLFLAFINNIRSLNDSEESVVKLLEVLPRSTGSSQFTQSVLQYACTGHYYTYNRQSSDAPDNVVVLLIPYTSGLTCAFAGATVVSG